MVSGRLLLPTDLEDRLPAVERAFAGFRDDAAAPASGGASGLSSALIDRVGRFDRFLAGVGRRPDRPSLDFLHTELPHVPWSTSRPARPIRLAEAIPPASPGQLEQRPVAVDDELQARSASGRVADRLAGQLMRGSERGLYDAL